MNYFLWSRLIYAVPFLFYLGTEGRGFLDPISDGFIYAGTWIIMFLLSLFFFAIAKKELPRPLVHFIFIAECFIYYHLTVISGQAEIMLVALVLSSFYAIDSLRNSLFSIGLHLLQLYGAFALSNGVFNILPRDTLILIVAPLFCRALMSVVDERDIVVREEYHQTDVYVPVEDTTVIDKMRRKANFFFLKNKKLHDDIKKEKAKNESLKTKVQEVQEEADAATMADLSKQQINKDIARMYFSLLANIRVDLSKPMNENLDRILKAFALITKAQYTAVIAKEPAVNKGEAYSLALTNSYSQVGNLQDETVIENQTVWDKIIKAIDSKEPQYVRDEQIGTLKYLILTPIAGENGVKGVLVQGFGEDYEENIHNFNIALMVAYQLYTAMENESLYKQAKDGSNTDALTGLYNKKFLMNSLPVTFNSAYNYSTNLACVFIAEDTKQNDEGIVNTARAIEKHIRKTDFLYRYSDNSFVVLFMGVSKKKLEGFADEINEELASLPTTMSVSMGAKIYDPMVGNVEDGKELLEAAVRALYKARRHDCGQIVVDED